jgi:phospholipase/lecithinase/hemolysin
VWNIAIEGVQSDNSLSGGDNFAFGGARARNDGAGVPDLAAQVGFFNAAHPSADPNALYLINVGGNDIFDILSNPSQAAVIMNAAATAISTSVLTLQGLGAQHILVMGVGDVGSPPLRTASRFRAALPRSRSTTRSWATCPPAPRTSIRSPSSIRSAPIPPPTGCPTACSPR